MSRKVLAAALLILSTGCVTQELAWCSSAPPVLNRVGSSHSRAVEVLKSADRLESSHLGPAGVPSCFVAAYRYVITQPHAADTFRRLVAESRPVGKIYALAGLYDTDPAEFARLVATAEAASPATFERLDTCIGTSPSRDQVFAQLRAGDLSAWWRPPISR